MIHEGLITWTILVTLVSSGTSYLFMKYKNIKNIIIHFTDFTNDDIKKVKDLIRWKF